MFVDQSGFYLLPTVVHAPMLRWARDAPPPREAHTRSPLGHERHHPRGKAADARSGESFQGRGCSSLPQARPQSDTGQALNRLGRGSPIHRSKVLKEFLKGGAAERVGLEQLPGYAPELNPDEGIWKHLKYTERKNLCCQSLAELRVELGKAKERLRHKKHVILGCIRQPGLEV